MRRVGMIGALACAPSAVGAQGLDSSIVPDGALRATLEIALDSAGLPESLAGLGELRELIAPRRGIRSLEGLEYASGLEVLDLTGNEIGDASPVGRLGALRSLRLGHNRLSEVGWLSGLERLEALVLGLQ